MVLPWAEAVEPERPRAFQDATDTEASSRDVSTSICPKLLVASRGKKKGTTTPTMGGRLRDHPTRTLTRCPDERRMGADVRKSWFSHGRL